MAFETNSCCRALHSLLLSHRLELTPNFSGQVGTSNLSLGACINAAQFNNSPLQFSIANENCQRNARILTVLQLVKQFGLVLVRVRSLGGEKRRRHCAAFILNPPSNNENPP